MSETDTPASSTRWGGVIDLQPQQLLRIGLLGATAGLLSWLLSLAIRYVVFIPLFCGDPANNLCIGAADTSSNIGLIVSSIIALMGLVRLSVYRPLFIVIAAVISLWGIGSIVTSLQWYEAIFWMIILYAITYLLFAWLVRLRSFIQALVVVLIVVILARTLPML